MRRWLSTSRSKNPYIAVNSEPTSVPGQSPFMELPREIRDMIYRELLLDTHPLISHLRRASRFDAGTRPYPAILRTNKQIHDEAAAVFYGENTWFSAAPVSTFTWADEIYDETSSTYVVEPAPINKYLPWIKYFVLFADGPPNWLPSRVVKAGDVTLVLKRMGIERHDLKQLVVCALNQALYDEIANENQDWLEPIDETEMQRRFYWVTQRSTKPAFWLISREQDGNPASQ